MLDVIIVGVGPAGSAAALKCAEYGLKGLVLEKSKLPRDKVCSGMIMGPIAHKLIEKEFGNIPKNVLSSPDHLLGYMFHVPGVGTEKLDNHTLLCWRKNLDQWMSQKAQDKGAEVWESARVIGLCSNGQGYSVEVEKDRRRQHLEARFVIGADGAVSITRKLLFREHKVRYAQIYQECYQSEIKLDKRYFHWFYPLEYIPTGFTVHYKDNFIVLDVSGKAGYIKNYINWFRGYLAKTHDFDIKQKPVWKGGCLEPILYKELTSGAFSPAAGNCLLVGDAAGFLLPISGEGIGSAIKSGLLAAESIVKAIESGKQANGIYLNGIRDMICAFEEILPWMKRIKEETRIGGHFLPEVVRKAYLSTLRDF